MSYNPRMQGVSPFGVKMSPLKLESTETSPNADKSPATLSKTPVSDKKKSTKKPASPQLQVAEEKTDRSQHSNASGKTHRTISSASSTRHINPLPLDQVINAETISSKLSERKLERDKAVNDILKSPKSTWRTKFSKLEVNNSLFGEQTTGLLSSRAKLCIDSLAEGCIEAFILLFELSHRKPVVVDQISEKRFKIPVKNLQMIKQLLCESEQSRRQGDFISVYNTYKKLADYFESEKDIKTAIYFHQRGQDIAKTSSDTNLESKANENIGFLYERLNLVEKAMKAHETQLSLAEASKNETSIAEARKQLVSVYVRMASTLEDTDSEEAIKYYEKAFRIAKATQEKDLIAETTFNLGKIYESYAHNIDMLIIKRMQDYEKAISTQQAYSEICSETQDMVGKTHAQNQLAYLHEKSGNNDKALELYKESLRTAEDCGDDRSMGNACEKIGTILIKLKQIAEAVPYFEKNFALAQRSQDRIWLTQAKVQLGFARGEVAMAKKFTEEQEKQKQTKANPISPVPATTAQESSPVKETVTENSQAVAQNNDSAAPEVNTNEEEMQ